MKRSSSHISDQQAKMSRIENTTARIEEWTSQDILYNIFSYLHASEWCKSVNLVNKDWYNASSHNALWLQYFAHSVLHVQTIPYTNLERSNNERYELDVEMSIVK
jgi:hypothetical protein